METLTIYKGDTTFNIPFTLHNSDDTDKDITGLKPVLKVWKLGYPNTLLFSGSTTISVGSTGDCYYVVTSTDLVNTGNYIAEIELQNTTSGLVQTWNQFNLIIKESE